MTTDGPKRDDYPIDNSNEDLPIGQETVVAIGSKAAAGMFDTDKAPHKPTSFIDLEIGPDTTRQEIFEGLNMLCDELTSDRLRDDDVSSVILGIQEKMGILSESDEDDDAESASNKQLCARIYSGQLARALVVSDAHKRTAILGALEKCKDEEVGPVTKHDYFTFIFSFDAASNADDRLGDYYKFLEDNGTTALEALRVLGPISSSSSLTNTIFESQREYLKDHDDNEIIQALTEMGQFDWDDYYTGGSFREKFRDLNKSTALQLVGAGYVNLVLKYPECFLGTSDETRPVLTQQEIFMALATAGAVVQIRGLKEKGLLDEIEDETIDAMMKIRNVDDQARQKAAEVTFRSRYNTDPDSISSRHTLLDVDPLLIKSQERRYKPLRGI